MISLKCATFGAELEIADVDTRLTLPQGNVWDRKDSTICNSSGAANDPLKILNKYGSEVQTRPTENPDDLVREVLAIYTTLSRYSFNFTTNLHVHIRVPGLRDDLVALQRVVRYLACYAESMFRLIDPLEAPTNCGNIEEYEGAIRRYRRRLVSHWWQPPSYVYEALLSASTIQQFRDFHRLSRKGVLKPSVFTIRAGVNMLQLWETDTIEFRCFTMTDDSVKLYSAFYWPLLFMEQALGVGKSPAEVLKHHQELCFQKVHPYCLGMDRIFQLTNLRHNTRTQVEDAYRTLLFNGVLKKSDLE